MIAKSFTYSFPSSKTPEEVFALLLDINQWWSGNYGATFKGITQKLGDEFTVKAGSGAHYTKQKMIELVPNKRVVWLVTDCKLNFLNEAGEWTDTKICFDISTEGNKTQIIFTHDGLVPGIECYEGCSGDWTKFLEKFKNKLN